MSANTNLGYNLKQQDGPCNKMQFTADASVVTQAAQNIPPGSSATSTTKTNGNIVMTPGLVLSRFVYRFVGDVANVGGQLAAITLALNGVAITGATSGTVATTAGAKTATIDFAAITPAVGDIITAQFTVSVGALTAVCTDINVAVGGG